MKAKKIPSRICVGCREPKEKRSMVRVVKTAENNVCLDETGKMNGRGAYICKNTECLLRALQSKGLERSLKTNIPEEVIHKLKEEMSAVEAR
ncbi:hypothetical protein C823_001483 [Eubacterium plexicaudatum ASF492]|uniref:YlxR domain-containing protein n=1 Tax=Eubacterium plexicaudatum ASF492 TaxID=1235802 RepID=N2BDC2_9FIRM|nr:hypothetical protein C823_001483 [Eubacterium plexicaudatum ASF492]